MANDKLVNRENLKAFRQANDNRYAKPDGNYPTLTAGLADNLDTKLILADNQAYNSRPSGGSLEIAEECREKAIVGGSLGFNNILPNGRFTNSSYWSQTGTSLSVANNICSFTAEVQYGRVSNYNFNFKKDSKYLIVVDVKMTGGDSSSENTGYVLITNPNNNVISYFGSDANWHTVGTIFNGLNNGNGGLVIGNNALNNWKEIQVTNAMVIDLTAMFGSTIANYIYNLETGTTGAGVAWFKRYFPKPYYSYKAVGGFTNVITRGKKVVGFNQCISFTSGSSASAYSNALRAEISEFETDTYYTISFKQAINHSFYPNENLFDLSTVVWNNTADGRRYFYAKTLSQINESQYNSSLGGWLIAKNSDNNTVVPNFQEVCMNFHYDGERDGEYEPYQEIIYDNDPVELIGIPKIDAQGNLYFEGNKYNSDGSIDEEYAIVDLGTLDYQKQQLSNSKYGFVANISDIKTIESGTEVPNIACPKYITKTRQQTYTFNEVGISMWSSLQSVCIYDSALESGDATAFKSAMSGIYLIYPKATPTQGTLVTPFQEQQQVFNWGTEERLPPLNDTRPCEVPVGHETDYLTDLKSKLEILPNLPSADGTYVCKVESGVGEYIPLATWLLNNGYPTGDTLATKEALGGTLRQLLCVKESLDFNNTDFIDLSELNWLASTTNVFYCTNIPNLKRPASSSVLLKGLSTKYKVADQNSVYGNIGGAYDKCFSGLDWADGIQVRDSAYNDVTAFKAAMKGVLLAYEKA